MFSISEKFCQLQWNLDLLYSIEYLIETVENTKKSKSLLVIKQQLLESIITNYVDASVPTNFSIPDDAPRNRGIQSR